MSANVVEKSAYKERRDDAVTFDGAFVYELDDSDIDSPWKKHVRVEQ